MKHSIPYGRQEITDADIVAVTDALKSDYLTQGPRIAELEESFAKYVGAKYAVAVSNGTAALHLCTMALGVGKGQKVITPPITFAASANCIAYCGGEVVFSDIDSQTYVLDIEKVRKLLKDAPKGTYAGIVPVDFTGYPVDLEEFKKIADEYGLWIIEDACHAPGGYFINSSGKKSFCGSGEYADLAIFSFHPVKHIAAGEGGMITTNDEELYQKLLLYRTHGITKNQELFKNSVATAEGLLESQTTGFQDYPGWYYEMLELGYNYRLTDFQSALALSQLSRVDQGLKRRRGIAARYDEAFADLNIVKQSRSQDFVNAYHLYVIEVEDRKGLYDHLRNNGVYAQVHYIPLHTMPYYQQFGWKQGDFPLAEEYYRKCLSIPMYPSMTDEQQDFVIKCVKDFLA